jgi:hypothetical protein
MVAAAVWVAGSRAPLLTVIKDCNGRGVGEERVPEVDNMCVEAPVSRYQSSALGGLLAALALVNTAYRALVSQLWAPPYVEEDPPSVAGF